MLLENEGERSEETRSTIPANVEFDNLKVGTRQMM